MAATEIFVYGTGGHGRVVADLLRSCGYDVAGWIDDAPSAGVLSWEAFCSTHRGGSVALGIGENGARERIFRTIEAAGYPLPVLIHPSAVVSPGATLQKGSVIMPQAVVNTGALVGCGCIINSGAVVEHDCVLGDFVHVSPNAALAGGVKVGRNTHIGIGASLIQNLTIGKGSLIAAGSAVIRDVPDHSLAAGVPAVIKKGLCKAH